MSFFPEGRLARSPVLKPAMLLMPAALLVGLACSHDKRAAETEETRAATSAQKTRSGIEGEWEFSYAAKDLNGNLFMDDAERQPIEQRPAHDAGRYDHYFRFNEDGTCVFDKATRINCIYKLEANPEGVVPERNLVIYPQVDFKGWVERYSLISVTDDELVLSHAIARFAVYKRIK
jgi:hypothetical protein